MMLCCTVMHIMTSRYRSPHRGGRYMICSLDTLFGLFEEVIDCLMRGGQWWYFHERVHIICDGNETKTERDIEKTY